MPADGCRLFGSFSTLQVYRTLMVGQTESICHTERDIYFLLHMLGLLAIIVCQKMVCEFCGLKPLRTQYMLSVLQSWRFAVIKCMSQEFGITRFV